MRDFARPFRLFRRVDHTGRAGVGHVADGVLFPDGAVVIRWRGGRPSTVVWERLDDAVAVHGHNGDTVFEFADGERI